MFYANSFYYLLKKLWKTEQILNKWSSTDSMILLHITVSQHVGRPARPLNDHTLRMEFIVVIIVGCRLNMAPFEMTTCCQITH